VHHTFCAIAIIVQSLE